MGTERKERKPFRASTVQLIPLSFLLAIAIGTLLLLLPFATVRGETTDYLTALFTATTSTCVTGLVVENTFSHWTTFGQAVILTLVQIGGLGIVAVGSMIMILGKKKFSFGERKLLGDSLNVEKNKGLLVFLRRIFRGTFLVEGIGAALYACAFVPEYGVVRGIWYSVFQSVSAFCNAGMDIIGPNSMIDFNGDAYLMGITMALIILGGMGFVVWFDLVDGIREGIKNRLNPYVVMSHLSEHSKLVLTMTVVLLLAGMAGVFVAEYQNPATIGEMSLPKKLLNSLFQSVTFRTAGFASVPQEALTEVTCVLGSVLMFIGGSPVGTAGGVKTVTAFLVFTNAIHYVRGDKEAVVFKRKVSREMMRKAAAVVFVSFGAIFVMLLLLMGTGDIPLTDAMYEVVSAIGTVGLSRGLTPNLNTAGRIIIILSMYLGRIGPISLACFFTRDTDSKNRIKHAEGTFYVG
ncbi:MAG: potassium transporter TrkH [Lachnospiraceae bacterium]|nr:potassium transporter TrkH [Lachnospiraceae bacterium]